MGPSAPSRTAFTVYVNGVETRRVGLQSGVWTDANRDNLVSFSFSGTGGVSPGDTITVSYIVPPTNPIRDSAGNLAPAFTKVPVQNDRTSYSFTSDPGATRPTPGTMGAATRT